MPRRYRVGVVGFGMAGGLTAHLLAADGHEVTLLERAETLHAFGAGVLLQVSGQKVLRHLGVLDDVIARSAPLTELDARHVSGEQLICNKYTDLDPNCRAYGVHRGVLFNAVKRLVEASPVEVRLGAEVVRRATGPTGVTLIDTQGRRHGPYDFIVSGDGSRSCLRRAFGFTAQVHEYAHGTLWAVAAGTKITGKLLQIVDGTRRLFGLLPLGDGLSTLYWGLPVRDFDRVKARGMPALKREILAFAPEADEILESIFDFNQLLPTVYRHVRMPRTFDRTVLFMGDSAHAMSPHLGQGINLAMVDAWRFAACLRLAIDPLAAFIAFEKMQRAYLRFYAAVTFGLSPFFQSDVDLLGWGRDMALPILPYIPWVKRQMLLTMTGQKGGFLSGPITV